MAVKVEMILGDCATVLKTFDDGCIDLTVTSPPYDNLRTYNGYTFDFEAIAQQLWRVTKLGGVVVWVVGDATINGSETGTSFRQALYFRSIGFNLFDTMIYEVAGTGAKGSNNAYWQAFEFMFVLTKGYPVTTNLLCDRKNITKGGLSKGRVTNAAGESNPTFAVTLDTGKRTNIWRFMTGFQFNGETDHPAPFPEALARDHILSWSNPGDTVLDPMCGSGTTLKMALTYGRNAIGIDISQEYLDISRRRVDRVLAQPNLFEAA
jgi:DNA modification methylase